MTLKEELEILRGEPIEVFEGDPMDIPCIETSDPERLCKNPVVSVHMITYNHEPYIRQAIEGVMMQKTDFEFELVIGEDCSQDKTREICFEYQKKYPDKIRVLWWHENVSKLGGNGRRNRVHCRGEFIAFCEGDDYWIDPLKLQKQVDIMRCDEALSFCFTGARIVKQSTQDTSSWNRWHILKPGKVSSRKFLVLNVFGRYPYKCFGVEAFLVTASVLIRKASFYNSVEAMDILTWRLRLGDVPLWLGLATVGDVYYLPDETAVYRRTSTGAVHTGGRRLWLDNMLVRLYYMRCYFKLPYVAATPALKNEIATSLSQILVEKGDPKLFFHRLESNYAVCKIFENRSFALFRACVSHPKCGLLKNLNVLWRDIVGPGSICPDVLKIYSEELNDEVDVKTSFISRLSSTAVNGIKRLARKLTGK